MEAHYARTRRSLRLAALASLLLHAVVLLIGPSSTGRTPGPAAKAATAPPLSATLSRPSLTLPSPQREATVQPKTRSSWVAQAPQQRLSAPDGFWSARSWSRAERDEMNRFLDDLAAKAKPRTGRELSQDALSQVREMERYRPQANAEGEGESAGQAPTAGKSVAAFSLEMYFDAFIRKLNRSAAFVKNDPEKNGLRKALVQISLHPDGTLKSYRVLRSADQQVQIAYIKRVLDLASPFAAFPPDLVDARGSLSILMCIYTTRGGEGSGFMRSAGAQDCKD